MRSTSGGFDIGRVGSDHIEGPFYTGKKVAHLMGQGVAQDSKAVDPEHLEGIFRDI